jgi:DNA-binding IclR family transcriptional regulator
MFPAQPNQSLMHGIECLQAIAIADGPLGSREVARRLDLEHTKVNRLLGTLAALGFVTRTADRRYVPGPALHVLSAQSLSASGLLQASIPVLRRGRLPDMVVALGVVWRDEVCYLVHAAPGVDPADAIGAHRASPAAESVIGRCLAESRGTAAGLHQDAAVAGQPEAATHGAAAGAHQTAAGQPQAAEAATHGAAARSHHAASAGAHQTAAARAASGAPARVPATVSFRKPDGELSAAAAIGEPAVAAVAVTGPCAIGREEEVAVRVREMAVAIDRALREIGAAGDRT